MISAEVQIQYPNMDEPVLVIFTEASEAALKEKIMNHMEIYNVTTYFTGDKNVIKQITISE